MAKRIGELLVESGMLSQPQLDRALDAQRSDGRKLGSVLVELGLISELQLTQTLSRQLSVPWVSLFHVDLSGNLLALVPKDVAERHSAIPIYVRHMAKQGDTLYVAMDDPTNDVALDAVARASGMPVRPMIACPSDIRNVLRAHYLADLPPFASAYMPTKPAPPLSPPQLPPEVRMPSGDSPDSPPEIEAKENILEPKARPKMVSMTLLDGTKLQVPSVAPKRPSAPDIDPDASTTTSDSISARDLISALRAAAHGVDASEILGREPRWEAFVSALLALLLRKGLLTDAEVVEEFRKL